MIISSLSSGLLRGALRDELVDALVDALDVGFERLERGTNRVEAAVAKLVRPIAESAQTMVEDVSYLAAEGRARGDEDRSPPKLATVARELFEVLRGRSWVEQYDALDNGESAVSDAERDAREQLVVGGVAVGAMTGAIALPPLSLPLLAVVVGGVAYQVRYTYQRAWAHLREERSINLDVLNSITITIAAASGSLAALSLASGLSSAKKWVTARTEGQARRSITASFSRHAQRARVKVGAVELEVDVDAIERDATVVVSPGEVIPVDGEVLHGAASLDERMLTGESALAEKGVGDQVLAGTVVLRGRLELRADRCGEETVVAQIARMLADTSDFKRELKSRASAANERLLLSYAALGAFAGALWGIDSGLAALWSMPTYNMITLAPLTMLSFMHLTSRRGLLIKTGRALEELREVDTFVFDKTGTLTQDVPQVGPIYAFGDASATDVLRLAVAAERDQTHPIALAIQAAAAAADVAAGAIDDQELNIGYGVSVAVGGSRVSVGSDRLMEAEATPLPPEALEAQRAAHERGRSLVFVARDRELVGALEVRPRLRPEAAAAVAALRRRGRSVMILSGDHEAPTRSLAEELGVSGYRARVLPQDKAAVIQSLQADGRKVCFVGDGINDALALDRAAVSISLKGATAVATSVADIILMSGTLEQFVPLLDIAESFEDRMRVNRLSVSVPAFISLAGAVTMGWGFMSSVVLNQALAPIGYYNSLVQPVVDAESQHKVVETEELEAR